MIAFCSTMQILPLILFCLGSIAILWIDLKIESVLFLIISRPGRKIKFYNDR